MLLATRAITPPFHSSEKQRKWFRAFRPHISKRKLLLENLETFDTMPLMYHFYVSEHIVVYFIGRESMNGRPPGCSQYVVRQVGASQLSQTPDATTRKLLTSYPETRLTTRPKH